MYYDELRDPNSPRAIARDTLAERCEEEAEEMVKDFRELLVDEVDGEILDGLVASAADTLYAQRIDAGPDCPNGGDRD